MPVVGIGRPGAVIFQKYHTIEAGQMRIDGMRFRRRTKAGRQVPVRLGRQLLVAEKDYEVLDNSIVYLIMDSRIRYT